MSFVLGDCEIMPVTARVLFALFNLFFAFEYYVCKSNEMITKRNFLRTAVRLERKFYMERIGETLNLQNLYRSKFVRGGPIRLVLKVWTFILVCCFVVTSN